MSPKFEDLVRYTKRGGEKGSDGKKDQKEKEEKDQKEKELKNMGYGFNEKGEVVMGKNNRPKTEPLKSQIIEGVNYAYRNSEHKPFEKRVEVPYSSTKQFDGNEITHDEFGEILDPTRETSSLEDFSAEKAKMFDSKTDEEILDQNIDKRIKRRWIKERVKFFKNLIKQKKLEEERIRKQKQKEQEANDKLKEMIKKAPRKGEGDLSLEMGYKLFVDGFIPKDKLPEDIFEYMEENKKASDEFKNQTENQLKYSLVFEKNTKKKQLISRLDFRGLGIKFIFDNKKDKLKPGKYEFIPINVSLFENNKLNVYVDFKDEFNKDKKLKQKEKKLEPEPELVEN